MANQYHITSYFFNVWPELTKVTQIHANSGWWPHTTTTTTTINTAPPPPSGYAVVLSHKANKYSAGDMETWFFSDNKLKVFRPLREHLLFASFLQARNIFPSSLDILHYFHPRDTDIHHRKQQLLFHRFPLLAFWWVSKGNLWKSEIENLKSVGPASQKNKWSLVESPPPPALVGVDLLSVLATIATSLSSILLNIYFNRWNNKRPALFRHSFMRIIETIILPHTNFTGFESQVSISNIFKDTTQIPAKT